MSGSQELAAAVDGLYALPPKDFTAQRDAMVKQARASGDRELADRIRALRRPTAGAHLVNLLARQHPDELGAVIELGSSLRTAQQQRDRDELRDLGRRQQLLVSAVMKLVRALAAEGGQRPTDAVTTEVEQTIRAAMADPGAAAAARSGALTASLHADGLAAADVSGSIAAPELVGTLPTARGAEPVEPAGPSLAEQAQEARQRKLERARVAAQQALDHATSALDEARSARQQAFSAVEVERDRVRELADRLDELHQQVKTAERELAQAEHDRSVADQSLAKADRAAQLAEQAETVARQRLESL